ncbi:hypothetical protein PC117_g6047 [Phytophthora cactorum]|uniref:Uncharacterized protein n=1 Tax=Phytophthora cactorum TaxID=29920 RepID=A0A8T1E2L4_9STRA|nr:hypothetical protein PC117_g6047 [Phytophthora cactorum]
MSSFLRKDLMWWNELVFQNEFAGLPMELFEKNSGYDEAWPIVTDSKKITLTSMRSENAQCSGTWCRIIIHDSLWISDLVDEMNCKSASGQHGLRHLP